MMTKDEKKAVLDALESSIRCHVLHPTQHPHLVAGLHHVRFILDGMPDDYEPCGECGYDHAYEYDLAARSHIASTVKEGSEPE